MSGEERPLRLLSLDGGGVRGLSSLIILQHLMRTINLAHPPKPCDYFDLIGGTSTGGLIAIMLGRLKMDIEECITAYLEISRDVFQPKKRKYDIFGRASDALKVRGRFDSEALKRGIQKIVVQAGEDENAKLKIEDEPKCRVFVCAIRGEMGMHTTLLRGYESKQVQEDDCTIWEAGRATSAASSFFDPIKIGQFQKSFVDGGTGCNNPVEKVYEEALNIWGLGATKQIQCIVSVGTGQPLEKAFGSSVKEIASTIIRITTETERTAVRFARLVAPILGASPSRHKVYYRFNVIKGLEEVGLERYQDKARIAAATRVYLNHPDTSSDIVACAAAMSCQMEVKEAIDEPTYSNEIIRDRTSAEVGNSELIKNCLRSLAFPEIDARLHSIEQADKDTCRWIFESTQFRNWESRVDMTSHNGVLWIKGKPGAGKSTLMKQIWLHLRKESGDSLLAAFFFHGRGKNALEKSPLGMLRSVLYQFLEQNARLCEVFLPIFLDKQRKHGVDIQWHFGELKSFLLSSVETLGSDPIVLLVDALDECMDEEVQSVVTFLESLACSAVESDKTLNICLASRHYPQIRMGKVDEFVIETRSEHDKDIMEYVRQNLIVKDTEIEQEILQKAAHVFLWVELVVKMINKAYNDGRVRAMKKVLRDVPSDLDDLYRELLTKGQSCDEIRETLCMLQWVLFAKRALLPEELYFAVLSDIDPDHLGSWDQRKESRHAIQRYTTTTSKGLIEVRTLTDHGDSVFQSDSEEQEYSIGVDDTHKQVVQVIHESVKDFLVSVKGLQSLDSSLGKDIIGKCHSRLANCCLSYIMMRSLEFLDRENAPDIYKSHLETGKITNPIKLYPFLPYALTYILDHIEAAGVGGVSQVEVLVNLQQGSEEIRRIQNSESFVDTDTWEDKAEVIHVAAGKGFYETLRVLLGELKVNVDAVGGYYGTALQAAARMGHENIVHLCLDHGADVNAVGGCYYTALHAAVHGGSEDIVKIFLEHGADVSARDGEMGTALYAAKGRYTSQACVDLLLQYGAEDLPPIKEPSEEETDPEEEDWEDTDSDPG